MRLLLVEDDPDMVRMLRKGLTEQSYAVDIATSGSDALERANTNDYDAVVLDVMIPPPNGFEVCRQLRDQRAALPILMLTARDAVLDRITGLDCGADDYLVKPFAFAELLARLRAILRRGAVPRQAAVIEIADLRVDTARRAISRGSRELPLTTTEYALLEFLARNAGRVVSREDIAEHVWNESFDPFSNLIEVYINRLRRLIDHAFDPKLIHTIRGAGYILEDRSA